VGLEAGAANLAVEDLELCRKTMTSSAWVSRDLKLQTMSRKTERTTR
jgi:hypothetical protein